MVFLGYRVTVMSRGERFTTGTIEPGGYAYQALIFDQPSEHGIDRGRISKLEIKDRAGQIVVEYDRGYSRDAQGRPERHSRTQVRLIKAMMQTFPGKLEYAAQRPTLPDQHKAADKAEQPPERRLGLDKHRLANPSETPPPQKLFVPHQRVRFAGFSCTMPPGCPDPDQFRKITQQLVSAHFGSEEKAAGALRAYEEALDTKGQFAGIPEAARRYQEARVLASPLAQAWELFEDDLRNEFRDYDEDGEDKAPAIPGWDALHVAFQSAESERGERFEARKARAPAPRSDDGREID